MKIPNKLEELIAVALLENAAIKNFLHQMNSKNRLGDVKNWQEINIPFWILANYILNEADETDELKHNIEGDPDFNALKNLIFKAIAESSKVKEFLQLLRKKGLLDKLLEAEDILITQGALAEGIIYHPITVKKLLANIDASQRPLGKQQYIDGIPLSPNEERFEEYCAERFNETKWLNKHHLLPLNLAI
ncbi:MAG: hypothetical protein HZC03_01060 [Candidatus Lloydbacteria bacterium]|nr:hypothetical protein [Candidatus Lloydbacteria bacterium]